MGYQSYRDLNIYKTARKLTIEIHEMSLSLPKFEMYETKSLKETETYKYLCEEYDHLGKMITNFIKSVEHGHKTKAKIPPGQTSI